MLMTPKYGCGSGTGKRVPFLKPFWLYQRELRFYLGNLKFEEKRWTLWIIKLKKKKHKPFFS